jgi:hypothetical protein
VSVGRGGHTSPDAGLCYVTPTATSDSIHPLFTTHLLLGRGDSHTVFSRVSQHVQHLSHLHQYSTTSTTSRGIWNMHNMVWHPLSLSPSQPSIFARLSLTPWLDHDLVVPAEELVSKSAQPLEEHRQHKQPQGRSHNEVRAARGRTTSIAAGMTGRCSNILERERERASQSAVQQRAR